MNWIADTYMKTAIKVIDMFRDGRKMPKWKPF